ncbi:hypothetical protein PUNSTDRAFT_144116 [Punctularia strigosozonata HHB-11173 SS5]|uniref:uncharacterized protein n=1 Tax=Punctularia strigosozonata (strain HHB-11173) TaxID=741275 RepID=UPI000441764E|nr:uncharacterized protein PUNSTDRAFT_144116 [Punctularia strigosozonata HHB-11173 SS5]EIN08592.1 hypothetical protein PUNSTDRAFT_144116 [Punctularia strigosozonata HHB-11173 SS5]
MKFLAALSLLVVGASAIAVVPSRTRTVDLGKRNVAAINPPKAELKSNVPREALPRTNAERLARGLPLKKPRRARALRPARVETAKRQTTSSTPTTYSGVLQVVDYDTEGTPLGYVGATPNDFGEYGVVDDVDDALQVSFTTSDVTVPFDISVTGTTYPFLGGTVSSASDNDDLSYPSSNYAYLTNVDDVDAGSSATSVSNSYTDMTGLEEDSESAIWTYVTATNLLAPQWVNTDGTLQPLEFMYLSDDNALVLTGDTDTFVNTYGAAANVGLALVTSDGTAP